MSMIADILTVLGGGAGIFLLLAMAALPLYADTAPGPEVVVPPIPSPRPAVDEIVIPLQRCAA